MKFLTTIIIIFSIISCGENNKTSTENNTPEKTMEQQHLFVGTYTKKEGHVDGKAEGIHHFQFNPNDSKTTKENSKQNIYKTINPSYISFSPNKDFLYAVNELNPNDGESGTVTSFSIDKKTKELTFLNQQITHNYAPCHITLDATGKLAFVSNYVGGVFCTYQVMANGSLDKALQVFKFKGKGTTGRQEASHPHSATVSPDNKHVYVADLGTDKVMCYKIESNETGLVPTNQKFIKVQDGAGPRHMDFHPNGKLLYVLNELDRTVNTFDYDSNNGSLTQKQSISTLPKDFSGFSFCAAIKVHPSGKFLYASNRGHNSIVIFSIDPTTGMLSYLETEPTLGDFPRDFSIDSSGDYLWVANQNSDNIIKFKIDLTTGLLTKVSELECPTPVCLKFL